jgi:hypothetical protein
MVFVILMYAIMAGLLVWAVVKGRKASKA